MVSVNFLIMTFIASHTFQIGVLSVCLSISALILYLVLQRFMKVKTFD